MVAQRKSQKRLGAVPHYPRHLQEPLLPLSPAFLPFPLLVRCNLQALNAEDAQLLDGGRRHGPPETEQGLLVTRLVDLQFCTLSLSFWLDLAVMSVCGVITGIQYHFKISASRLCVFE